jgi:hypothetical protein
MIFIRQNSYPITLWLSVKHWGIPVPVTSVFFLGIANAKIRPELRGHSTSEKKGALNEEIYLKI